MKVPAADVVVDSHEPALDQRKRAFRRVGMNVATDIFLCTVANALGIIYMTPVLPFGPTQK